MRKQNDDPPIARDSSGNGPPLLLVHGSGAIGRRWLPVRPALEAHFTVHVMDRRGHGESGDDPDYALDREAADIARVLATLGTPADIVAHSYGAVCALRAACAGAPVRRLVLYEPPIPAPLHPYFPPDLIPAMRAMLDQGQPDAALAAFLAHVQGAGPEAIAAMRRVVSWDARVAMTPTLLRELEAVDQIRLQPRDFVAWRIPTLLLRGEDSAPHYHATAEMLAALLPGSRIEILPGQGHGAIDAAPDMFAEAVTRFLLAPDASIR